MVDRGQSLTEALSMFDKWAHERGLDTVGPPSSCMLVVGLCLFAVVVCVV